MRINHDIFFSNIRKELFDGSISNQSTVDTLSKLLMYWEVAHNLKPIEYLAYIIATAYHETGHTLYPNKERGSVEYFKRMYDINGTRPNVARMLGNVRPGDGSKFPGAGLVHITGRDNYRRQGNKLGIPLEDNPELALRPDIAIQILIDGMLDGDFTGKSLLNFTIDKNGLDTKNARLVVNGINRKTKEPDAWQEIDKIYHIIISILRQSITNEKPIDYDWRKGIIVNYENAVPGKQPDLELVKPIEDDTNMNDFNNQIRPPFPNQKPRQNLPQHNQPSQFPHNYNDGFYDMNNNRQIPQDVSYQPRVPQLTYQDYVEFMQYKQNMNSTKPFTQSSTMKTVIASMVALGVTYFGLDKFIPQEVAVEVVAGIATVSLTLIGWIRSTEKKPTVLRLK